MEAKRKIRYAKVDEKHCAGCGLCEKACPASVIEIIHEKVS